MARNSNNPFKKLGLNDECVKCVTRLGFNLPTPIQRKLIPELINNNENVVACARTGSGKTIAFLLPMIHLLGSHSEIVGIRALIVSPSRELALQTSTVLQKLVRGIFEFRICNLVGGMSIEKEFHHLALNPDCIIGTPGRIKHQLSVVGFKLDKVIFVVFDEADRLFELGFDEDLVFIIKALNNANRKIVIVSATIPESLTSFVKSWLVDINFITLDSHNQLSKDLELIFLLIRDNDRVAVLLYTLNVIGKTNEQVIIFCSTAHHVEYLRQVLADFSLEAVAITGTLDQETRIEALDDFVKRRKNILIATDVAARGLDIYKLGYVINYNFPASPKLFIHRAGRTARANSSGVCICLLTRDDLPYLFDLGSFCGIKFKFLERQKQTYEDETLLNDQSICVGAVPPDLLLFFNTELSKLYKENSYYEKLNISLKNAEKQYNRYRQPASQAAMSNSADLIKQVGSTQKLFTNLHDMFKGDRNVDIAENSSSFYNNLMQFKVKDRTTKQKSTGVYKSLNLMISQKLDEIRNVEDLAKTALTLASTQEIKKKPHNQIIETLLNCDHTTLCAYNDKCSDSEDNTNDFVLGQGTQNAEFSQAELNKLELLKKSSFGLLFDDDQTNRKLHNVKAWDKKKMKYKTKVVDSVGREVKKTADNSISKQRYKTWKSSSQLKILPTGTKEPENVKSYIQSARERRWNKHDNAEATSTDSSDIKLSRKISDLTRDSQLKYKVAKGMKLTNRESRKLKKIKQKFSLPITYSKPMKKR